MTESHSGTLYVVASPIGNAQDLSPRALETLRTADLVLAEDTRSARKLLDGHGIDRRTQSCFDANEPARAAQAAALLRSGASIALLSEAGTPTVSDPGYRVVRAAIAAGARVVPVPGPSAVLAALVGSGLPTDRFFFVGFPPRKTGARQGLLAQLTSLPATLVFFESPHRVAATLADLSAVLGKDRPACLAAIPYRRSSRSGAPGHCLKLSKSRLDRSVEARLRGGASEDARQGDGQCDEDIRARARALLASGLSARDAADALASETGRPRRETYRLVLDLRARE